MPVLIDINRFVDVMTEVLEQHWPLSEVPRSGGGVQPFMKCRCGMRLEGGEPERRVQYRRHAVEICHKRLLMTPIPA